MLRTFTVAALLALAACSGEPASSTEPSDSPTERETRTLEVVIADGGPLDVYFNHDDTSCSATSISDAFAGTTTPRPEVVVRDGAGEILATAKAPRVGGEFTPTDGCRVTVPLEVPSVDFYEVTVTAGTDQLERTATAEATEADAQEVMIQF